MKVGRHWSAETPETLPFFEQKQKKKQKKNEEKYKEKNKGAGKETFTKENARKIRRKPIE